MKALLNITGYRNKEGLNAVIPIYFTMTNIDKLFCLGLFQAAIDALLDERNIKRFAVMTTLTVFRNMPSMKWDADSVDSMATGWLENHDLFGPWDKETNNDLNTQAVSLLGGNTATSNHGTEVILKMVVVPPVGEDSIDHLRRLKIAALVCLPAGHVFLAWVRSHLKKSNSFRFTWGGLEM